MRLGFPSVVEAALMPGLMRTTRIMDRQLSGRVTDAPRAYEWGLVNPVVPGGDVDATVEGTVQIVLLYGPRALAAQKGPVYHGWMAPLAPAIGIEALCSHSRPILEFDAVGAEDSLD